MWADKKLRIILQIVYFSSLVFNLILFYYVNKTTELIAKLLDAK